MAAPPLRLHLLLFLVPGEESSSSDKTIGAEQSTSISVVEENGIKKEDGAEETPQYGFFQCTYCGDEFTVSGLYEDHLKQCPLSTVFTGKIMS